MRIVLWNANGLAQHKFELELFLKQQQIDVMLMVQSVLSWYNQQYTASIHLSSILPSQTLDC